MSFVNQVNNVDVVHQVMPHRLANDFVKQADSAQYGRSDYSNAVRVERGISLEEAFRIAKDDPNIDYFCYTKGSRMVLTDFQLEPGKDPLGLVTEGHYKYDNGQYGYGLMRVFDHGDVVFFKNEGKWLGSAPGLADTYSKK